MKRSVNYASLGLSMFCAKEAGTTDEHIIPRGLGGKLVIIDGTCETCLGKITSFESSLINRDFEAVRVFLGIPSASNKVRSKMNTFYPKTQGAKAISKKYAPSSEDTGVVIFLNYRPPGLEDGRHFDEQFPGDIQLIPKCFIESNGEGLSLTNSTPGDLKFPRLLAKIAHSYWIANNGLDSISYSVVKYITGDAKEGIGFFVGGYYTSPVPNNDLHFIQCGISIINNVKWAYVDIGLFASYAPQTNYRVYVGVCLK